MANLNAFDEVAGTYDLLAGIVFGKSIKDAQRYFIGSIPPSAKILIMGGGTGWLLAEIVTAKPACEVWYIEASAKMIALAKQRVTRLDNIHFIHGTENNIPEIILFDVVITNFYLDLFSEKSLKEVVSKIASTLKPGPCWIATDFVDNRKWWHQLMLKIMYQFFRFVSGIEAKTLPDWNERIQSFGLRKVNEKRFYGDFITTDQYIKDVISVKDF